MPIEEFTERGRRVEADRLRVGTNVGPPEQAKRPVREIVALQRFEQRQLDLGLLRYNRERNLSLFAMQPEPLTKR